MATYYVSPSGSDANNGLGPDASHASNKPWLTIGKALGAAGIASGDTVYIGPGTYREVVTVAMTSATAETSVLGDPGNAQGFKNGSGVLLDSAEVVFTAYTTNDTTAPSASALISMAARDFLTFRKISFVQGTSNIVEATTQTSTNIKFQDCCFYSNSTTALFFIDNAFGVPLQWMIERCFFSAIRASSATLATITSDTGTGADYDIDMTIRNCVLARCTSTGVNLSASGAGAQKPGGVLIYNCTWIGTGGNVITVANANWSTSIPAGVYNCACIDSNLSANTLGQVVEDYNYIMAGATHTNVTQGANTVTGTSRAPNVFNVGFERSIGANLRSFYEPKDGSWVLTFGNDATNTTNEDALSYPRPSGGESAVKGIGALVRNNSFSRETGTVRTGTTAISITGPGTQDFQLPVDASSTTVSMYVRWDATYAGTKPQMKVLNGEECGVTAASTTATGGSGSWEELTLNFTPTSIGIVTIRLQSNDTNGAGVMFADDFSVT